MSNLVQEFGQYSHWRAGVAEALDRYAAWLSQSDLSEAASEQRIARLRARLAEDKLAIAFVAEFSRGKSELINAIFFAEYGQRILPSAAGRTTMCPTELLYDEAFPPCIRLLPIETRAQAESTADLKAKSEAWTVYPLDTESSKGMLEAFRQVSLTKRVSVEEATAYGLFDASDADAAKTVGDDGLVEVSHWRHAIVNFPHPLLKQGLIIIDTPGLNAIGTEPELTLNLIPNAHAVLYILAADTGVTKSDIDVWREHISGSAGRIVVLNKIDSMWDELRSPSEVAMQIRRQADDAARTLEIDAAQVFPVSAQKGLVAKIQNDSALLQKSRLLELEQALSGSLLPSRKQIMCDQIESDMQELMVSKRALLSARSRSVVEQMVELKSLRGKNRSIVSHMMKRIDLEKKEFDESLVKLQGTRAVFTSLGVDVLKENIRHTREAMESSKFSSGFVEAVRQFFARMQLNLVQSSGKIDEIGEMMSVMYRKFSTEHGLALAAPMPFSLDKYRQEIRMIEGIYQKQFGTGALMTTRQVVLMQKFFDSIATRVRQSFVQANRDVEAWLKVVMAPLEAQIREHKKQLKQRMQSIERIDLATGDLEEKIAAFERMQGDLDRQLQALDALESELRQAMGTELPALAAAA